MFFFGIATVVAAGFLRTNIQSVRDIIALPLDLPLIGVFVNTGKHNADRDGLTAVATHELRNTLFSDAGTNGTRVFTITGAGMNGNQTGVAFKLAQSFAMAGYQTLLVDGDLANENLTKQHGFNNGTRGLRDLIATGEPKGAVHRSAKPRLWIMPTGASREVTPDTLSADDVSLFLEMAKKPYDIIIVDAGSATQNLEAVLFTAASDRVVLTVDHDEAKSTVIEATNRLDRTGAPLAGIAYTGAQYDDARRAGMLCDRATAEALYPDGLSRPGREAPSFGDPVAGIAGDQTTPAEEEDEQIAA